jgi:HSP20 family protein
MQEQVSNAELEQTIHGVERLYRAVTGREVMAPEAAQSPMRAEQDPTRQVSEQLDRLAMLLAAPRPGATPAVLTPAMSVWEQDGELVVRVDLPGSRREDVQVEVVGDRLQLSARRDPATTSALRPLYCEVPVGAYSRSIALPPGSLRQEIVAALADGVLEVRVKRAAMPEPERREIPVR